MASHILPLSLILIKVRSLIEKSDIFQIRYAKNGELAQVLQKRFFAVTGI